MTGSHGDRERLEPGARADGSRVVARTYSLSRGSRLTALLLGVVALGLVAVLLAVGFTVLVALVVLGTVAGVLAVARRAVRARVDRALGRVPDTVELDPAKQVFPPRPNLDR